MNRPSATLDFCLSAMLAAFLAAFCVLVPAMSFLVGFAVGKFAVVPVLEWMQWL